MKSQQVRTDRRGRVRRDAQTRQKLIAEFKRSGKTQAAFCRARGIRPVTFNRWLRTAPRTAAPIFAEVELPRSSGANIEVLFANGTRVRLTATEGAEQTAALVRRIVGC